ncbi:MAG: glycosyltransferase family 4 protein [Caldilineaceae bacterium]|nr:glycosyltransferase family 4 protein [Caldilineaceae bacterium]
MNIGIVTTWFERGAGYVSRQYKEVLEPAHKVLIYARGGSTYAQNDPNWQAPYVTWGKRMPSASATVIELNDFRRWLLENKIELVIFNEQLSWPPVLFCNDLGILTGAYVDYYTEDSVPLFACYDFLICNTKRHYAAFDWHPQCWYVPWGTDLELFKPTAQPSSHTELISPVRFFHSGGMNPRRKGTDLLIEAFAALDGHAHLTIHGQVPLKATLPELGETIDALMDAGRLTNIEKTVSAPGLYHLGDVYVYPTRLEGIGLTIAEALACGLPVITTDQPPMNEFVQEPENGRLVSVERLIARADGYYWPQSLVNVDSLRGAMQFYLDHPDQLATYKVQARHYAETYLDWRKNAQSLLTHLCAVKKRAISEKMAVSEQALAYEPRRRQLYYRYPTLSYYAGQASRRLSGILKVLRQK